MTIFQFLFGAAGSDLSGESRTERAHRHAKDRQTIKALKAAGSNVAKPHSIEHHFITYDRPKAEALIGDGRTAGYTASAIESLKDENGNEYYFFNLIKQTIPVETTMFAESLAMTTLGHKHSVVYDGWGCIVEP